jgi:hypothetical protein
MPRPGYTKPKSKDQRSTVSNGRLSGKIESEPKLPKVSKLKLLLELKKLTTLRNRMNKETVLGVIRHVLTFGGGFVAAKFGVDEGLIAELIGGAMTVIGVIWSIASKRS